MPEKNAKIYQESKSGEAGHASALNISNKYRVGHFIYCTLFFSTILSNYFYLNFFLTSISFMSMSRSKSSCWWWK
jgi:hypothetical protein